MFCVPLSERFTIYQQAPSTEISLSLGFETSCEEVFWNLSGYLEDLGYRYPGIIPKLRCFRSAVIISYRAGLGAHKLPPVNRGFSYFTPVKPMKIFGYLLIFGGPSRPLSAWMTRWSWLRRILQWLCGCGANVRRTQSFGWSESISHRIHATSICAFWGLRHLVHFYGKCR